MAKSKSYNIGGSKYAFDFDGDPIKLKGIQKANDSGDFDNTFLNPNTSEFGDIADTDEALDAYNIDKHGGNKDLYEDTTPQATAAELNDLYNNSLKSKQNQQSQDPPNLPKTPVYANSSLGAYQGGSNYKRKNTSEKSLYAYPFDIDPNQDHMKITKYDYIRPSINASKPNQSSGAGDQTQNVAGDSLKGSELLGSVLLPMPKVVDVNGAEWGESKLSAAGLLALQTGKFGADVFKLSAGLQGGTTQEQKAKFKREAQEAQRRSKESGQGIQNSSDLLDIAQSQGAALATSGIAQLGATALGTQVDANTVLARVGGVVQNPNAEMLFQGPVIRDFSFAFKMIARSEKEGEEIRKIIKFFKKGMAPKFRNTVFIATPNIFTLDYRNAGGRLKTVNKFNPGGLALTTLNVDYAPSGYWSAYRDSQPVAVKMDMTFTELRPIYEKDQLDDDTFGGLDSVGY